MEDKICAVIGWSDRVNDYTGIIIRLTEDGDMLFKGQKCELMYISVAGTLHEIFDEIGMAAAMMGITKFDHVFGSFITLEDYIEWPKDLKLLDEEEEEE